MRLQRTKTVVRGMVVLIEISFLTVLQCNVLNRNLVISIITLSACYGSSILFPNFISDNSMSILCVMVDFL